MFAGGFGNAVTSVVGTVVSIAIPPVEVGLADDDGCSCCEVSAADDCSAGGGGPLDGGGAGAGVDDGAIVVTCTPGHSAGMPCPRRKTPIILVSGTSTLPQA